MRLVSVPEAAYLLNISSATVYRMLRKKELKYIETSGKKLIDIANYFIARGIDPVPFLTTIEQMKKNGEEICLVRKKNAGIISKEKSRS